LIGIKVNDLWDGYSFGFFNNGCDRRRFRLLFLFAADAPVALVIVVFYAVLVEFHSKETKQTLVALHVQLKLSQPIGCLATKLDGVINARRAFVDGVGQLAKAHFIPRHDSSAETREFLLDVFCCRFDFIARQHWIYDEGDFVMSHYQSVVKKINEL